MVKPNGIGMIKEQLEYLQDVGISALQKTFQTHEELGPQGEEVVRKNQFGESALRMDIEAERAVLQALEEANLPIIVFSEEHGKVKIGKKKSVFLGVLDGLDGSVAYKQARGKGRYGTMFGIFSNLDPQYAEYKFCGVMEHTTRRLFFAVRGRGAFVLKRGKRIPIHCSGRKSLDKITRIYADTYFDAALNTTIIRDTFISKLIDYKVASMISSAVHYVNLASGEVDLVLEALGKGSFEKAVGYGLVREAGGVMVTVDGADLGRKRYLTFGQGQYIPVVAASTRELAFELIDYLNRQ